MIFIYIYISIDNIIYVKNKTNHTVLRVLNGFDGLDDKPIIVLLPLLFLDDNPLYRFGDHDTHCILLLWKRSGFDTLKCWGAPLKSTKRCVGRVGFSSTVLTIGINRNQERQIYCHPSCTSIYMILYIYHRLPPKKVLLSVKKNINTIKKT